MEASPSLTPTISRPTASSSSPASVSIHCVEPRFVGAAWQRAAHHVKNAIARTNLGRFSDIERGVLYGNSLLWLILADTDMLGAAVTDLIRTETETVCVVSALGGGRACDWLDALDQRLTLFARAEGCQRMRIMGRKGWARALKNHRQYAVILDRKL